MLVDVLLSWVNSAPASDLIIDPTTNAATSEDVRLYDGNNYGNETRLAVGKFPNTNHYKARSLIKFDLSGVVVDATILPTTMNLKYYENITFNGGTWVDRWVQAQELLQLNFDEQWASRENRTIDIPWYTPYAAINDFDAKATMESTVLFWQTEQQTELPKWKSWDLTALTQKWLNTPTSNYGVILWATNEDVAGYTMRFHSSEACNSSDRPYLEVVYSNEAATSTIYFLKDHLGSIRATVLDTAGAPVCGYDDYDPWGYILAGRSVNSVCGPTSMVTRNKFTGKEFDDEFNINWNYFGARYYDARIGRFPVVDRFADKSPSFSPYHYASDNPVIFIDISGDSAWAITNQWNAEYIKKYQDFAKDFISSYNQKCDCADLALITLVEFASQNNLPLDLKYFDSNAKEWNSFNAASDNFTSKEQYLDKVTDNLGALNVIDNFSPISIKEAVSGDLIQTKYSGTLGHARVIYSSTYSQANQDYNVVWYQGNLPAVVPQRRESLFKNISNVFGNNPRRGSFSRWTR